MKTEMDKDFRGNAYIVQNEGNAEVSEMKYR